MRSILYKLSIAAILLILVPLHLKASHLIGGSISYVQTGINEYQITMTIYRNCSGLQISGASVNIGSSCYNGSLTLTPVVGFPIDVSQNCPSQLSPCQGGTSGLQGIEMHLFEGTLTLPAGCSTVDLSYYVCCRANNITTLQNPAAGGFLLQTHFDAQVANNSPVFNFRSLNGHNNGINEFDFSVLEIDGDSLVYELVDIPGGGYAPGYSGQYPIDSLINFDQSTGLMTVLPTSLQQAVVVVKVSEYRNGVFIGSMNIEAQIIIYNTTNINPTLTGIDSTNVTTAYVYAGDTVDFDIYSDDPNALQTLTMTLNNPMAGVNFTTTTASHPVGNFYWETDTSDIRSYPYFFSVSAQDDGCPLMGFTTKIFKIYVRSTDTTNVWPGDANNDLIANNYDLLSLGLAYGKTGPVRANASLNWIAQPAIDWSTTYPSGVNHKFADCNGDGIVDTNDIPAILLNYGMTHNKKLIPIPSPDLYVQLPDSIGAGDTIEAPIILGVDTSQISDIYGLAFTFTYDPSLVDSNTASVVFYPSWIGTEHVDMITLQKDFYTSGQIDVGISRINQINATGFGDIGKLGLIMQDDIAGKVGDIVKTLNIGITNIKAIDKDGQEISVNGGIDSVIVVQKTIGIPENRDLPAFHIYPNPADDELFIDFEKTKARVVYIQNAVGQILETIPVEKITGNSIDISNLAPGIYFVRAEYGNKLSVTKKVLVF